MKTGNFRQRLALASCSVIAITAASAIGNRVLAADTASGQTPGIAAAAQAAATNSAQSASPPATTPELQLAQNGIAGAEPEVEEVIVTGVANLGNAASPFAAH